MLKLVVLPAFFVAVIVGVIAGLQYASGDRAKAIKTAEEGVAHVLQALMIGVATAVVMTLIIMGGIFYFFHQ